VRVETADLAQLGVSAQFSQQLRRRRVIEDHAGNQGAWARTDRVVVAAATATALQDAHELFVGQHPQDQQQSLQVAGHSISSQEKSAPCGMFAMVSGVPEGGIIFFLRTPPF
jgi:hypothetical protein